MVLRLYLKAMLSLLLAFQWLGQAAAVYADAIAITRAMQAPVVAEYYIDSHSVRVQLEIAQQALAPFRDILPQDTCHEFGIRGCDKRDRQPAFFREQLVILGADGQPLNGRVLKAEARWRMSRDEVTGEVLAQQRRQQRVAYLELEYPFDGNPSSLTLVPLPVSGEGIDTTLGFIAYHKGISITDFRYLGGPEVIDLDWSDPWYSVFRNKTFKRQYDAPLSVFLYVEPFEVRVEVIARPKDLMKWTDLGLGGLDRVSVKHQPQVKQRAAALLLKHLKLRLNATPTELVLDRINFLQRNLKASTVIDPPRDLDLNEALLGAIYVVPTQGLPRQATLAWELFVPKRPRIAAATVDEAGSLPAILLPEDNLLVWQNFLPSDSARAQSSVPLMQAPKAGWSDFNSLGLGFIVLVPVVVLLWFCRVRRWQGPMVGVTAAVIVMAFGGAQPAAVDSAAAREIVTGLLHNIYRAFDFREEGRIYDQLESSVSGELLSRIYLETRQSLELAGQGGARVKVKGISLDSLLTESLPDSPGFAARTQWTVTGSVGHWGHVHERTNQYQAELRIEPAAGYWKISDLQILSEQRL